MLESEFPGVLASVKQTEGYYLLNASWGVTTIKGAYIHISTLPVRMKSRGTRTSCR